MKLLATTSQDLRLIIFIYPKSNSLRLVLRLPVLFFLNESTLLMMPFSILRRSCNYHYIYLCNMCYNVTMPPYQRPIHLHMSSCIAALTSVCAYLQLRVNVYLPHFCNNQVTVFILYRCFLFYAVHSVLLILSLKNHFLNGKVREGEMIIFLGKILLQVPTRCCPQNHKIRVLID